MALQKCTISDISFCFVFPCSKNTGKANQFENNKRRMSLDLANNKANFGEKVRDGKFDDFFSRCPPQINFSCAIQLDLNQCKPIETYFFELFFFFLFCFMLFYIIFFFNECPIAHQENLSSTSN